MLFKKTMILVLVVWQLASWVKSDQEVAAEFDRARRALLKRRMLERLAERGHEAAEREILAEELLARLEAQTTTELPFFPLRREPLHHSSLPRRLEEAAMLLVDTPKEEEEEEEVEVPLSYLRGQQAEEALAEAREEAILEGLQQLDQYLRDEVAEDRALLQEETRPRRLQRSNQRKERERRRESKKKKREEKKRKSRRYKRLLEQEDVLVKTADGQEFLECCPSEVVVSKIVVGKSRDNMAMDIRPSFQLFYERVCREGFEGKECVFPPRTLRKGASTRCEQQYSNTQAIARPYESDEDYQLQYIQVRSGCSCQINVTQKKRKRKRKR